MEELLRIQSDTDSQGAGQQTKSFIIRGGSAVLTLSERGRRNQRCTSSAAADGRGICDYSLPQTVTDTPQSIGHICWPNTLRVKSEME